MNVHFSLQVGKDGVAPGIDVTVLMQKDLLQNQDFREVDFKKAKIISVCSGFYSLGLIHFI